MFGDANHEETALVTWSLVNGCTFPPISISSRVVEDSKGDGRACMGAGSSETDRDCWLKCFLTFFKASKVPVR